MHHRPLLPIALAVASALAPHAVAAWSDPGHRIVAAIAEERLSPAARRLVREIVGSMPLSDHDVAVWADDIRDRRTGPWHYVNVPFSAEGYVPSRDCLATGCAVSALEAATRVLRDGDSARDLADSLRWIVHLVADLHQPMHAGEGRDRGGNDTEVRLGRRRQPINFHRLWDAEVVEPLLARSDPLRAAHALGQAVTPADATAWSAVPSPAAWASESHLLARALYGELATFPFDGRFILLPRDYPESQRARTATALSKAGVRLAALLDRVAAEREARGPSR